VNDYVLYEESWVSDANLSEAVDIEFGRCYDPPDAIFTHKGETTRAEA
jgi:hypothetical protein